MMLDASAFHISNLKLPNGQCVPYKNDKGVELTDCWSHAVEYDVETNAVRPLKVRIICRSNLCIYYNMNNALIKLMLVSDKCLRLLIVNLDHA